MELSSYGSSLLPWFLKEALATVTPAFSPLEDGAAKARITLEAEDSMVGMSPVSKKPESSWISSSSCSVVRIDSDRYARQASRIDARVRSKPSN